MILIWVKVLCSVPTAQYQPDRSDFHFQAQIIVQQKRKSNVIDAYTIIFLYCWFNKAPSQLIAPNTIYPLHSTPPPLLPP